MPRLKVCATILGLTECLSLSIYLFREKLVISWVSQAGRPRNGCPLSEGVCFGVIGVSLICALGFNGPVGLCADVLSPGAEPVHPGYTSLRETTPGEGEGEPPGPNGHSAPNLFLLVSGLSLWEVLMSFNNQKPQSEDHPQLATGPRACGSHLGCISWARSGWDLS